VLASLPGVVPRVCALLQMASLELDGKQLDNGLTVGSLRIGEDSGGTASVLPFSMQPTSLFDAVLRPGPIPPSFSPRHEASSASQLPRKRLEVPFKYQGRLYDVEWYMDQPFGEIAEKLGGLRPVKAGVIISDEDTPSSLGLDGEGFIFLVGRLKRPGASSSGSGSAGQQAVGAHEGSIGSKASAATLGSRIVAAASARAAGGAAIGLPAASTSVPSPSTRTASSDSVFHVRCRLPPGDRVFAYDWGSSESVASFKVRVLKVWQLAHPAVCRSCCSFLSAY
jgi:hypothetical protein